MEVYLYRCPDCGYICQIPSYWMGYAPEETHDQMHFSPATLAPCANERLTFAGESDEE